MNPVCLRSLSCRFDRIRPPLAWHRLSELDWLKTTSLPASKNAELMNATPRSKNVDLYKEYYNEVNKRCPYSYYFLIVVLVDCADTQFQRLFCWQYGTPRVTMLESWSKSRWWLSVGSWGNYFRLHVGLPLFFRKRSLLANRITICNHHSLRRAISYAGMAGIYWFQTLVVVGHWIHWPLSKLKILLISMDKNWCHYQIRHCPFLEMLKQIWDKSCSCVTQFILHSPDISWGPKSLSGCNATYYGTISRILLLNPKPC